MSHRTVIMSSFEEYLASEDCLPEARAKEEGERKDRLSRFPYAVTLQVSFAELDFANRWCWQHFGPGDGECFQRQSDYPVCSIPEPHSHTGKWMWYFLVKTDYDFGFCEWYFSEQADRDCFLTNVGEINWGEKYG
jgi:hypothetical protein